MAREYTRTPVERRLFAKVTKTDNCWLWNGGTNNKGYGQILIEKTPKHITSLVHRLSWAIHHGPIPDGLSILHRCDNPLCVNPQHLFLGTQKDNMADCSAKGRVPRGSRSKVSKLTEEIVLRIRAEATGVRGEASVLAKKYGMSREMVGNILARRNWKHI